MPKVEKQEEPKNEKKPKDDLIVGSNAVIIDRIDLNGVHLKRSEKLRELNGKFIPSDVFIEVAGIDKEEILNDIGFKVRAKATSHMEQQEMDDKEVELQAAIKEKNKERIEELINEISSLKTTPPPEYIVKIDFGLAIRRLRDRGLIQ